MRRINFYKSRGQLYAKVPATSYREDGSDFLKSIGKRENVEQFFEAHIKWIKENVCDDPAILIDGTGMPNNIHFPLTAISHNKSVFIKCIFDIVQIVSFLSIPTIIIFIIRLV